MLDLLIQGGLVADGSGTPAVRQDVGVLDGRIVEVGSGADGAKLTIDADGLVVAPGFIDLHSHYDAQLFWDPTLSPSPLHGVTTAVSGNCGLTLAPAAPGDREFLTRLLSRVEAIPVEALLAGVTYEWESFAELLDVIEAKPLALNIGFMVGHSALRRAVMGPAASTDKASPEQIEAMRALLGAALAAGGFGFSTANVATQVDGDGRPTPPNLADPGEFIALAAECGLHPGTSIEFIPGSFLSGFSDGDVELMADMSAAANRHLNWNTPLINRAVPDLYERQFRATDVARERGGRVVPMFMPQNGPLRHDFKEAYVFRAVPGWAELFTLQGEARLAALQDPATRAHLEASVDAASQGLAVVVRNWATYEVNDVGDPALAPLLGRNVGDLAAERGVSPFDAMLDIVVEAKLDVGFVRYQYPGDDWTTARAPQRVEGRPGRPRRVGRRSARRNDGRRRLPDPLHGGAGARQGDLQPRGDDPSILRRPGPPVRAEGPRAGGAGHVGGSGRLRSGPDRCRPHEDRARPAGGSGPAHHRVAWCRACADPGNRSRPAREVHRRSPRGPAALGPRHRHRHGPIGR